LPGQNCYLRMAARSEGMGLGGVCVRDSSGKPAGSRRRARTCSG
jgi:hypothetical protein